MSIKSKLQNPFVLGAQGFVIGAALFLANGKAPAETQASPPVAENASLIRSFGA